MVAPPPGAPGPTPPGRPNWWHRRHGGVALLIASLICFVLSLVTFIVPALLAQRAEASSPGAEEGYGFIAVFSIFPCGAACVLLVVALVQLSRRTPK